MKYAVAMLGLSAGMAVAAPPPPCPVTPGRTALTLVRDTCADLRLRLADVPGGTVRLTNGTFVDERLECTRDGCTVKLSGSFSALGDKASPSDWLGEYLEKQGWSPMLSHDADGP